MTAPLEGAALFGAAFLSMGYYRDEQAQTLFWQPGKQFSFWSWELEATAIHIWWIVPLMLEWLRGRGRVTIDEQSEGDLWVRVRSVTDGPVSVSDPDLPTALARLVLKVAELEGRA